MTNESIVQSYFKKINDENFDFLECFTENGEFKAPGFPVYRGKGEIRKFYQFVFNNYPEHMDYPLRFFEKDDCAAVEIKFVGKSKKGIEIVFYAVDIFEFENGKIRRLDVYYDNHEIMKKLGLLK